ncbi:MAG: 3-methyl-2-oxobutanoate hydroxymethyltransferase, partial [Aquiluna sp.]
EMCLLTLFFPLMLLVNQQKIYYQSSTDAQILVWTDFAGLGEKIPSFARQYLALRDELTSAAKRYANDVRGGNFPSQSESFS